VGLRFVKSEVYKLAIPISHLSDMLNIENDEAFVQAAQEEEPLET
jgi:hypothetical protein